MSTDYNRNGRPARFSNLDDKLGKHDPRKLANLHNCAAVQAFGTDAEYLAWVDAGPELNTDFYDYTVESLAYLALFAEELADPRTSQRRSRDADDRDADLLQDEADHEAETHFARHGF